MKLRLFALLGTILLAVVAVAVVVGAAAPVTALEAAPQTTGVRAVDAAALVLTKTVGLDPNLCAATNDIEVLEGTEVTYCFYVRNSGDVTLTRHTLDDSHLGTILNDFTFSLTPGASVFVTGTVALTQTTVNTADWIGYNPGPADVVTATDVATVTVETLAPAIVFTATVGTDPNTCATTDEVVVPAGAAVTTCYRVQNAGTVTLTRHTLEDSEMGTILNDFVYVMPPAATVFVTQTAVVTQSTFYSATWSAYNPGPIDLVTATAAAVVSIEAPDISLSKTVGLDPNVCATTSEVSVLPGTAVTYCYEVENTGGVTLTRHTLADSELGTILDDFAFEMGPGASAFVTQTVALTQTTVNTAMWDAYNPGPTDVATATAVATVTVSTPAPAIALSKTVGLDPNECAATDSLAVSPGTEVVYCYTVTNTGNVALGTHDLDDSELGSLLDGHAYSLSPAASLSVTATATISETTVNSATWTAYNIEPVAVVEATDVATVTVQTDIEPDIGVGPASLAIELPQNTQGQQTLTITNTGSAGLTWTIAEAETSCAATSPLSWVAAQPTSGGTAAGASSAVMVTFSANGLAEGSYNGVLCVQSNDPDTPVVAVPVQLVVNKHVLLLPLIQSRP